MEVSPARGSEFVSSFAALNQFDHSEHGDILRLNALRRRAFTLIALLSGRSSLDRESIFCRNAVHRKRDGSYCTNSFIDPS